MVSDEHYELCLPILQDPSLEDEDKTDRLEELLKRETTLAGSSLENVVLDAMWRYREGGGASASPPPIRQSILRRPSPASWRGSPTPLTGSPRLGVSPLAPPGFVSTFNRTKSSTASPFSSPRASPRLALATPAIPHSPNLNAYEFASDPTPATEILGDYQTENVEWLVNDDAVSVSSSVGTSSGLNAAAPEFSSMSSQQADMSPYDMLRSILGQTRTDEEIEAALAMHAYDLSATITSIMESQAQEAGLMAVPTEEQRGVLIGKSISSDGRPLTPSSQQKTTVICKFYMSTGQCLRADCRFSHDLSNHLCKYWIMGSCLAGDTCIFSHDPSKLLNKLALENNGAASANDQGNAALQDTDSFPSLQEDKSGLRGGDGGATAASSPAPLGPPPHLHGTESPRLRSRPGSRQQAKDMMASAPALDDNEAFPSLGSASTKQGKKHHGKRGGHGHANKENLTISSLADIVRRTPMPAAGAARPESRRGGGQNGNAVPLRNGENSAASQAIPSPKHIPWLETGERANKAYLKARQEAIKHGGLRNKFLQSAAQAWNRNDARAAKALSLRGQSENDLMRKAHREAARELYEQRNKGGMSNTSEIYVDLHGLHPEEALEYLERTLMENSREARPVYAITGTGHHSKSGKDKVGRVIRGFLGEWRYAYREFSVPGDRNNMGGILGIDARSWDKSLGREQGPAARGGAGGGGGSGGGEEGRQVDILSQGVEIGDGKVRLLVRDPPKGPSGRR